jgi:hypothetical protein
MPKMSQRCTTYHNTVCAPLIRDKSLPIKLRQWAEQEVSRIIGRQFPWTWEDAAAGVSITYPYRTYVSLYSKTKWASIDPNTGLLFKFMPASEDEVVSSTTLITIEQARTVMMGVVNRQNLLAPSDTQWVMFSESGTTDQNPYQWRWRRYYQGIELPAHIGIEVNSFSPQISHYFMQDNPVVIPLQWTVSAEQAVRLFAQSANIQNYVIKDVHLVVDEDSDTHVQTLEWEVSLYIEQDISHPYALAVARVNANVGTVKRRLFGGQAIAPQEKIVALTKSPFKLPKMTNKVMKLSKPLTTFEIIKKQGKMRPAPQMAIQSKALPTVKEKK